MPCVTSLPFRFAVSRYEKLDGSTTPEIESSETNANHVFSAYLQNANQVFLACLQNANQLLLNPFFH
jgi:hypothetical protein